MKYMNLLDIKNQIFKDTQTTATSYPAADMIIDINNANNRVHGKIRKYLDNFRPTAWTTSDLSTGTATPIFDAEFHELIPLYCDVARANGRELPGLNGWLERIRDLERALIEWYGVRNYQAFTVTIASPGVVTKDNHGLLTNDRMTLITTGTLPTGLVVDTFYYVIYINRYTFQLALTRDGAAIVTSGTQSGVHYYATDTGKRIQPAYQNNK